MEAADIADLVRRLDALQANERRLIAEAHDNKQRARAFEKDAERYRKLEHDFSPMGLSIDGNHAWVYRRNFSLRGPTLAAAIDAAPAVGAA